jgi:hypothetical protein
MSEEEIEIVAQELARVGGTSWSPGRPKGAVLRRVGDSYRDQARAVIQANWRAKGGALPHRADQGWTDLKSIPPTPPGWVALPDMRLKDNYD